MSESVFVVKYFTIVFLCPCIGVINDQNRKVFSKMNVI